MAQQGPAAPAKRSQTSFVPDASRTHEIVLGGDVILVVGQESVKIQVTSDLLRQTSPVFKAMLDSEMKEGVMLRANNEETTEIQLPKDNPSAVFHAYNVLYGIGLGSTELTPLEIQKIAILADKYAMTRRFTIPGHYWLPKFLRTTSSALSLQATWRMMTAAYWLELDEGFFDLTMKLVSLSKYPLLKYANHMEDKILGLKLALAIEEIRKSNTEKQNMGICFHCFKHATEGFVKQGQDCQFPARHL
ncbi:hypothetical protein ACJZ2D_010616 [Fusarium nematophilum]